MTRRLSPAEEEDAVRDDASLLTDFLDDALPPERRAEVERRLATDPTLAAALDDALSARSLLAGLGAVDVPADFARQTRRRLRRRRAFRARRMGMERFGIEIFAVIAAMTMVAVYFFLEVEQGPALGPLREVPVQTHHP